MSENIIVHVSEVDISTETGMGRVEYYWKSAFEKAGFTFLHIGRKEVGSFAHNSLFPSKAYKYYKSLKIVPKAFIVAEPASGQFVNRGIPCFLESHGVERRFWEIQLKSAIYSKSISLKTRLLFPIWRLRGCDKGLINADKLLLICNDDKDYVKKKYKRKEKDILVFRNGVTPYNSLKTTIFDKSNFTVLFNGTWIARKGIDTLVRAASLIYEEGIQLNYVLIGTGKDASEVLADWPSFLRPYVKVVENFAEKDEVKYLVSSSLFVLPSISEGQPLSLLQAMAAGKCCITTNCCGQKDLIVNGVNGLLFTPDNVNELAFLIKKCYNEEGLVKKIGMNAKQSVEAFTWNKVSEDLVEFIVHELKAM